MGRKLSWKWKHQLMFCHLACHPRGGTERETDRDRPRETQRQRDRARDPERQRACFPASLDGAAAWSQEASGGPCSVGLPVMASSFFRLAAESTWLFPSCQFTEFGPILTVTPKGGLGSASWLPWHPGGTGSGGEGARAGRGRRGQCVRWHGLASDEDGLRMSQVWRACYKSGQNPYRPTLSSPRPRTLGIAMLPLLQRMKAK